MATQVNTQTAGTAVNADAQPSVDQTDVPSVAVDQPVNLTGRSVFVVETTNQGVMVRSAFMTEDKRLLDMPAVFPELTYALNVVDDLKRQITQQFAQAAQVGARVIAQQASVQANNAQSVDASDADRTQSKTESDK